MCENLQRVLFMRMKEKEGVVSKFCDVLHRKCDEINRHDKTRCFCAMKTIGVREKFFFTKLIFVRYAFILLFNQPYLCYQYTYCIQEFTKHTCDNNMICYRMESFSFLHFSVEQFQNHFRALVSHLHVNVDC